MWTTPTSKSEWGILEILNIRNFTLANRSPLEIGALWATLNLYDLYDIAFFKMVWDPKHKFLIFSEWFEGENH